MMKKISSIYKTFDIVVVPFPFTDTIEIKNRPALVVSCPQSFNRPIGQTILAMITSARHNKWPLDTDITQLIKSGLLKPSIIRLKLFTIDNRRIRKKIGELSSSDKKKFKKNVILALNDLFKI